MAIIRILRPAIAVFTIVAFTPAGALAAPAVVDPGGDGNVTDPRGGIVADSRGDIVADPRGDIQGQVSAYLAAHPGGRQISTTDIAYDGGAFVVSVVRLDALTGPDCPAGWFCFYDGVNYTYPRGKLSDCGFQKLSNWNWQNRVESAHYNMSTGSVAFIDETGSLDTKLFTVSTTVRAIADVGTARNRADYVFRYC